MSAIQVEGLWQFIQTLALTNRNKQWLADRLMESSKEEKYDSAQAETNYIASSSAMMDILAEGEKQIASGKFTTTDVRSLWN